MYKLDCERPGRGRGSSSSLGEFNARAREVELEHEVKRLKQVGPGSPCLTGSDAQVPTGWVSCEGARAVPPPSHTCPCLLHLTTWLPRLLIPITQLRQGGLSLGYI